MLRLAALSGCRDQFYLNLAIRLSGTDGLCDQPLVIFAEASARMAAFLARLPAW
jgi:hypothetical protein